MKRQKLEASQSGLLDDESLDIRDIVTSAVSRVPMVGGLLAEIVDPPEANAGASIIFGPEREENFRRWFGDSKIVDEEGKPLVVYHGTDNSFGSFDRKKLGSSTDAESAKLGFFYTDDPRTAQSYADYAATDAKVSRLVKQAEAAADRQDWDTYDKLTVEAENLESDFRDVKKRFTGQNIMPSYLSMQNPLEIDAKGKNYRGLEKPLSEYIKEAKRKKKDGVVFKNLDDAAGLYNQPATHYLLFEPTQIKSIYNQGTFDPEDPDILSYREKPIGLLSV